MSSRRLTRPGNDAVIKISGMTVQSKLTQLFRERCVSGVCMNGDDEYHAHGVLTILLVMDPSEGLSPIQVAPDRVRRELMVIGGSGIPFFMYICSWKVALFLEN